MKSSHIHSIFLSFESYKWFASWGPTLVWDCSHSLSGSALCVSRCGYSKKVTRMWGYVLKVGTGNALLPIWIKSMAIYSSPQGASICKSSVTGKVAIRMVMKALSYPSYWEKWLQAEFSRHIVYTKWLSQSCYGVSLRFPSADRPLGAAGLLLLCLGFRV